MLYTFLKKTLVSPASKILFRQKVEGLENLPEGGAIIASNHLAFLDSIFLPLAVPREVNFLAKSDYFTGPGIKGKINKWFFEAVGQIPMDRSGGARSAASLQVGIDRLQDGAYLGIYPEGTRSPDGRLYKAKLGVARLALKARVPVVPVGQIGNDKVQRSGSNKLNLRDEKGQKIEIRTVIGQPLDFSEYWDRAGENAVQRLVADKIIRAIQELTQQEYVPVYAATVKTLMAKEGISADAAVEKLQKRS